MKIKTITFFLIFFCILCFLFFAYFGYHWHFYKEEIDLFIDASNIKNLTDGFHVFLTGNTSGNAHPSNYQSETLTFLNSFYRPLLFIITYIQFKFFGMQAYPYYLTAISIHLLNAFILSIILRKYFSQFLSFLLMFLFIFHPAFATWIGNANMQQYLISTTSILFIFILLKKYFAVKKVYLLASANLLYLCTLFLRETIIAIPGVLTLLFFIYIITKQAINRSRIFLAITSFTLSSCIYIFIKQCVFPFQASGQSSFTNLSAPWNLYWLQINLLLQDILSLSWFPYGNPYIKIIIIITLLTYLLIRFLKSSYKKEIVFFIGTFVLFLWPAILIGYFIPSRYFYEAAPCYIFILGYLFKDIQNKKIFLISIFGIFTSINVIYTFKTIKTRQIEPIIFYQALQKLPLHSPLIHNNPLCFFSLTESLSWTGLAQQLWLYKISYYQPIYLFQQLELHPHKNSFPEQYISIKREHHSFIFSSQDKTKAWFFINTEFKTIDDLYGSIVVNKQENGKLLQVTVTPQEKYFHENTIFITWNYTNNEFFVLQPEPSNLTVE